LIDFFSNGSKGSEGTSFGVEESLHRYSRRLFSGSSTLKIFHDSIPQMHHSLPSSLVYETRNFTLDLYASSVKTTRFHMLDNVMTLPGFLKPHMSAYSAFFQLSYYSSLRSPLIPCESLAMRKESIANYEDVLAFVGARGKKRRRERPPVLPGLCFGGCWVCIRVLPLPFFFSLGVGNVSAALPRSGMSAKEERKRREQERKERERDRDIFERIAGRGLKSQEMRSEIYVQVLRLTRRQKFGVVRELKEEEYVEKGIENVLFETRSACIS
jgi:hypothetical protein